MKAMILAAGRGERMRPLSDHTPKPLLHVGDKALIEWHLYRLAAAGIHEIVINHAWLGQKIEAALGDGSRYGVRIRYSPETSALETAGGIRQALALFDDAPFIVMNGDVFCDWDPSQALTLSDTLHAQHTLAHLWLVPNPPQHPHGDFYLAPDGLVHEQRCHSYPRYTYSGIACFHPAFFHQLPANEALALGPLLRIAMQSQAIRGSLHSGTWHDIGTPERLAEINQRFAPTN